MQNCNCEIDFSEYDPEVADGGDGWHCNSFCILPSSHSSWKIVSTYDIQITGY